MGRPRHEKFDLGCQPGGGRPGRTPTCRRHVGDRVREVPPGVLAGPGDNVVAAGATGLPQVRTNSAGSRTSTYWNQVSGGYRYETVPAGCTPQVVRQTPEVLMRAEHDPGRTNEGVDPRRRSSRPPAPHRPSAVRTARHHHWGPGDAGVGRSTTPTRPAFPAICCAPSQWRPPRIPEPRP